MTQVLRARRSGAVARLLATAAVCVAAGTALAPGAAAADPFADGQWYVGPFKLADNHTVADGSGITVAVLDGMISPTAPSLAGADVVPNPTPCYSEKGQHSSTGTGAVTNHATAMAAMIAGQGGTNVPLGVAPGAKVLTYTIGFPDTENPEGLACYDKPGGTPSGRDDAAGDAIRDAVSKGARIVSMSYGGRNASIATQVAIQYAEQKGVVFVASTDDLPGTPTTRVIPPGSFNGVVLVNGIDRNAKIISDSATGNPDGPLVVASAPGDGLTLGGYEDSGAWNAAQTVSGSSPATAFVAGVLATTLSKWPEATGNQLIQSLARNTGGQQHDIEARALDGYGYGVVSLTAMLKNDPTAYPDENPTLRDGAVPSTGDILGSSSTSPSSPAPSSSGSGSGSGPASSSPIAASPATTDSGSSTGLIIGIAVGVVVVVALVVLVAVLVSRRGRRGGPPPPPPAAGPPPSYAAGGYRP